MESDEFFKNGSKYEVWSPYDSADIAEILERDALIRSLHVQFMNGEISQGKMAEMLGIGRADLIHLLEKMGLQVTNL